MTDDMSEQGGAGLDPTSVTLDDGTSALALDLTGVPGFDTLVFNTPDGSQVLVSDIGDGAQLIAVDADGQGGIDRAFVAVGGHTYAVNLATGQIEGEVDPSLVPTPQPAVPEPMVALPTWAQLDQPQGPSTATFPVMGPGPDLGDPTRVGYVGGPVFEPISDPTRVGYVGGPVFEPISDPTRVGYVGGPVFEPIDDPTRVGYVGGPVFEPIDDPTRVGYIDPIPNFPTIGDSSQQGTITWNDLPGATPVEGEAPAAVQPVPGSAYDPPQPTNDHPRNVANLDLYRAQVGVEALWTSSTHTPVPRLADGSPMPASAVLMTLRDTYATEAEKANLSALIQDVETRERLAARLR